MKEGEDTIEEKIQAMNDALEQLRTEAANLLLIFKKQVAFERASKDLSAAEKAKKHSASYEEILSEWSIIKALYGLLVSNVQEVSDIKIDEKIKPIEVILNKISSPETAFISLEFQFPFNLSVLLSGIRTIVKNFIKLFRSPHNDSLDDCKENSLKYLSQIASGPIKPGNVKNAAKMFQEITDQVAESAIRLKIAGSSSTSKAIGSIKPDTRPKNKGEVLFAKRAQETDAKPVNLNMDYSTSRKKSPAPLVPKKPTHLQLNGSNSDNSMSKASKMDEHSVTSDEKTDILQIRTPVKMDEIDNPLRSPSIKQTEHAYSLDLESQLMIKNNADEQEHSEVIEQVFDSNNQMDASVSKVENGLEYESEIDLLSNESSHSHFATFDLINNLQDKPKRTEIYPSSQIFESTRDLMDNDGPPQISGESDGGSSVKTIGKAQSSFKAQLESQIRSQIEEKPIFSTNIVDMVVTEPPTLSKANVSIKENSSLEPYDISSPVSKLIADECRNISRLVIKSTPAGVKGNQSGPPLPLTRLSIKPHYFTPSLHSSTASPPPVLATSPKFQKMAENFNDHHSTDSSDRPMSPKPMKSVKVQASSIIPKFIAKDEPDLMPLSSSSTTKTKERPKTLLQELKELTDNVAKRRQDIISVMHTDRDYIIGIMDAFAEVEDNNVDEPLSPQIPVHNFSPVNKTAHEQLEELSVPLVVKPMQTPVVTQFTEKEKSQVSSSPNQSKDSANEKNGSKSEISSKSNVNEKSFDATTGNAKEYMKRTISVQELTPWMAPQTNTQMLMIPLNAMFDIQVLDMSETHRFGRNNTTNHPHFNTFPTLVVSRNHADFWEKNKKIYMRDIGSSSGTFRNQIRLSAPNQKSSEVEIFTGDYIQLGKDFQDNSPLDQYGRIPAQKRCVKFQIVIIYPGQTALDVIENQGIPIEPPLNKSQEAGSRIGIDSNDLQAAPQLVSLRGNPTVKSKLVAPPPPPPLPDKDKPVTETKQQRPVTPESQHFDTGRQNSRNLNTSSSNLNKDCEMDTVDDIGFPLKEEFKRKALNDQYVISYTVSNEKVSKLQVSNAANSQIVMDANLSRWDDKNRITITDYRLVAQRTFDIFLETKPGAKVPVKLKSFAEKLPWQVSNNSGMPVGHMVYVNDIKMEIVSAQKAADDAQISIIGDFKQKKMTFIKKWPASREQARFGECQGKYLAKKSFLESQWIANVEVESGSNSRLLLCGIILNCCLNP